MSSQFCRWALFAASVAVVYPADVTEVQQSVDATMLVRPNVELTFHGRLRTQVDGLGFMQDRIGSIVEVIASERLSIIAGYYYEHQKTGRDWDGGGHRPVIGVQAGIWAPRKFVLDGRSVVERYANIALPSFTRYRERIRLSWNGRFGPYGGAEIFFDSHGWRGTRYSAGIRWRLSNNADMDLGYYVEPRRPDTGPLRHMWQTSFRFRNVHVPHGPRVPDARPGD